MGEVFQSGQTLPTIHSKPFSYVVAIIWVSLGCAGLLGERLESSPQSQPSAAQEQPVPKFIISTSPSIKMSEPVQLLWRISNEGTKTLYIYSAILHSRRRLDTKIDIAKKLITFDFTPTLISPIIPYSYSPLNFITLAPGQSLKVSFKTQIAKEFVGHIKLTGTDDVRVVPGIWKLSALFGYGYETESVEAAFSRAISQDKEDPTNTVVRWQRTAVSEPVLVKFTD